MREVRPFMRGARSRLGDVQPPATTSPVTRARCVCGGGVAGDFSVSGGAGPTDEQLYRVRRAAKEGLHAQVKGFTKERSTTTESAHSPRKAGAQLPVARGIAPQSRSMTSGGTRTRSTRLKHDGNRGNLQRNEEMPKAT